MEIVKNNLMLKSIKKKISMNFLFQNIIFLLILTFFCLPPTGRMTVLAQSFSFIDTGQRLGRFFEVASIACGDMNNDGYVDLVLASQERGTIIQLYLNDGEGNFTRTDDIFPVTENPNPLWNFGIVLRDFNRDGLLDIATADAWRGVNVYLNTKDRGFQWSQAILVPEVNEVKGIDAADIDHDGDDDLVFGGHNGIPDRADRIYLNDGTGNFIDSGQRIGFDVTWDTIFGDVDNDGNIDYISINRYREHTAKIHLNDGKGIFDGTVDIPTTQTDDSYDVKLVDLNMDGLLDIVIANSWNAQNGTTSKVFINQANLNFELTDGLIGEPNCETKGIEVIDIDNDGYPDIILGNYNWANTIYRNDGTGKFTKMDVEILANPVKAIAACDVNNDGFIDLIIGYGSDTSEGYYRVFLNDGKGLQGNLPPNPPQNLRSEINYNGVHLAWDPGFDPNSSALQFTESQESIGCLNAARLIVADVNGDGKLDIIVGNGEELRQQSEIYLNDGKGHFTFSGQTFDKYFLRDMVVGDIDGDGDVDWIVGTQGDGVKVLKNDGNGLFQIWQNIGSEYVYVRAVDLGDVDGDGDLDLLYGSVGNRIYLNDGKGNFVDSGQDLGDHYLTQVVKFADLNRDGHLDFVQGNRIFENYDPADRVFFNNGNGVFIDSGQRLGMWSTMDIDIGDVDGDGDLDLVTVCPLNGVNKLYLNDGNGFFIDSGQSLNPSPESNESHCVRFGDIDHDGDLDIVIGDWNLGLKIFLNDGYGHFTASDIPLGTGRTGHIVLVDIDHDGDLDIIESKKGDDCNKIYLNNQAKTPQIVLTYNIRIGTHPGVNDIVSGVSSYSPGRLGNSLSYRIQGLKEGTYYWSVQTVNSGFKKSEWSQEVEFIPVSGKNPLNDTTEFVKQQYRDFLNREAETAGLQYWANMIDSGAMTRAQVIESFFWSNEFGLRIAPIVRLYFAYFLRIPDYEGLMFWIDQVSNGQSLESISDVFAGSEEFQQTYGALSNEAFVNLVYQNILDRAPDSGGYAFWAGELNSGRWTRGQVMIGFSESAENKELTSHEVYVTMMYVGMLRRSPEVDGFNFWVDYLDSGHSGLALIDGFLNSQEYAGRF